MLSVNAGSSSVKFAIYTSGNRGRVDVERKVKSSVNINQGKFEFTCGDHHVEDRIADADHSKALTRFLREVEEIGITIEVVLHRIVHGGNMNSCTKLGVESIHEIEKLTDLAPLHNSSALALVQQCDKKLSVPNFAFFDTSFHTTIPDHVSSYAIDPQIAREKGLKRYGFHGLSYGHITRTISHFLDNKEPNLIVLHLGSGASACAIQRGKSIDTSMGLTPLEGLPGTTRSGTVDPSLIFHFVSDAGTSMQHSATPDLHITRAEQVLNKESGWKVLAGTSDFGDVPRDSLAFKLMVDRIVHYIGAYYVKLQGKVDALIFAGGIGEHSVEIREAVMHEIECLGYALDKDANTKVGKDDVTPISCSQSKLAVVVATNEELEMVRQYTSR